ncbi:MAG TPA: hemerythrin domain-containing protein [Bacteroidales bacterium]|jgi:regulator of cell morphogenesis and NO signaling|nr:hemerythrin domain-containing protein [Bacteroidales bacterium]HOF16350.1 hemerythrin domain-containing protein [Bacteroidales bacterium]HOR81900.1 hemerythrin domain-containing protein [Bacteroidales bacterium]HPJ91132.1 hemerythrin domain-containing protein [Bacteroidales bacterium]HQB20286.1 hemerythrin domain-containing protein [Bacteroidales bacterium]
MKPLLFTENMKLADVINANHHLILILNRFGIKFGFGEKTVAEVCETYHISTSFFLMVCNVYSFKHYQPNTSVLALSDIPFLISYLQLSHHYYLNERLSLIKDSLYKIAKGAGTKYGTSLQVFFDEYEQEVIEHFDYEEKTVFPYIAQLMKGEKNTDYSIDCFRSIHSNIEDKLSDLISILIKYLPSDIMHNERVEVLNDIFHLTEDLNKHSLIEEKILVPFVESLEKE